MTTVAGKSATLNMIVITMITIAGMDKIKRLVVVQSAFLTILN